MNAKLFIAFPLFTRDGIFNIWGVHRSILQLLVLSQLFYVSFLCSVHQVQTRPSSNQRLEQCVHAGNSHVWSTLVVFAWLVRKLSLIECPITIGTWNWTIDVYWTVQIRSIHFGEWTLFGALQRLLCVFPVKPGQKLQCRKLVGIDNMKNKLE